MLQIEGLSYDAGGMQLQDVELHINKEEIVLLFGEDDAGKTEVLSAIMGLAVGYEGAVYYQETDVRRLSKTLRKEIRYVPDSILLFEGMTARSYLNQMERTYQVSDPAYRDLLLAYFDIEEELKLTEMTYEENKLVAIVGALLTKPKLLILDEPANFLTKEKYVKLLECIQDLRSEDFSVLLVTETFEEASAYVDRYYYMADGRIFGSGVAENDGKRIKRLEIKNTIHPGLEHVFGQPSILEDEVRVYYTELDWCSIGLVLRECKVKDSDVVIRVASLQEVLDAKMNVEDVE